jgi:hypothetical protein
MTLASANSSERLVVVVDARALASAPPPLQQLVQSRATALNPDSSVLVKKEPQPRSWAPMPQTAQHMHSPNTSTTTKNMYDQNDSAAECVTPTSGGVVLVALASARRRLSMCATSVTLASAGKTPTILSRVVTRTRTPL